MTVSRVVQHQSVNVLAAEQSKLAGALATNYIGGETGVALGFLSLVLFMMFTSAE